MTKAATVAKLSFNVLPGEDSFKKNSLARDHLCGIHIYTQKRN